MKFFSVRRAFFIFLSSLSLVIPQKLLASKDDNREVNLAFVQGDVRISSGKDHRPDLNQPWEQALAGEPIRQGYALATGNGRAEIEFENGSMVYLAENSLLLFKELSTPHDRVVSSMSLATGTATFLLQSKAHVSYFIETPTDNLSVTAPDRFFARVDAFLDATAITPQGEQGETLRRRESQELKFVKGQTLFLQGGEVLRLASRPEGSAAATATPHGPGMSSRDLWELVLRGLPDSRLPSMARSSQKTEVYANTLPSNEWDAWVRERQAHRNAVTAAALKASGLSSTIPGLADLYEHGAFFPCKPYGTCWEAEEPGEAQDSAPQSAGPRPQSPNPMQAQSSGTFQPQTVQWEEWSQAWCSPARLLTVTGVAHTPDELQKLQQRRAAAQRARYSPAAYPISCENGYWIPYRHHFARVVTPQPPPHCPGAKCKPIHAPRPVWVRAGNRIGFVPAHPKDVKGKPPINLKEGFLIPPSRPGERAERVALEPSQKVSVLGKAPREFHSELINQAIRVSPPEIRAHLVQDTTHEGSVSLAAHATPPITYDYKSHHFLMPASTAAGAKSREVPVGGIDSHGKIGSFADGHSDRYAQSFGRSEAAGSYRGGTSASRGYGGYGSGYSGGGHGSGYSGSYSGGSRSSSSGSSGGGSSHSSGGGGWSSGSSSGSSSSGSSSSSAGSSGGGSRGRP